MEEKMKYVCPLCGTEYDTPKAMAHCVLECEEKKRAEEERLRREKLNQEKDKRWDEVVNAGKVYRDLYRQFLNDYPSSPWKTSSELWNLLWSL